MADYLKTASGLLVPLAEFADDAPAPKPELGEIASIKRDINRLIFGGALENLDDTLKTRGRGKGLKIYDEIERDAHAYAVLAKRKLAVVGRPWQVDPASDDARDQAAADLVARQLKGLKFDRATEDLLDATLKGFAVGEVMWQVRGAEIWAAAIKPRDQRRFQFDEDEGLRLLTRENMMPGELMPERKFVVHRFGAKDGSPYGLGLGNRLFWPVFFKRQDITFWLTFADKFGSPTAVGKYPAGASESEQAKLLACLAAIAQDAGIIVPEGMMVELLEAARSGSIDTYEKLARYMDEQISECVLGESITTTPQATGLGSGVANVQNDVRLELARADADMLSDTWNGTLVRWIVDYNLPGAGYPTVYRAFEEPEDLEKRSKVDQALHEMGYEPESIEQINETYGGKWRKKAAVLSPSLPPNDRSVQSAPAQFAESAPAATDAATADQLALAQAAGELSADWQRLLGARLDEVIAMAESSGDLVTLRERLAELLAGQAPPALAEALERAGFAAQLAGRAADSVIPTTR